MDEEISKGGKVPHMDMSGLFHTPASLHKGKLHSTSTWQVNWIGSVGTALRVCKNILSKVRLVRDRPQKCFSQAILLFTMTSKSEVHKSQISLEQNILPSPITLSLANKNKDNYWFWSQHIKDTHTFPYRFTLNTNSVTDR